MKRREMLQSLGSASVFGLFSNVLSTQTRAQGVRPFTVGGSGPALIVFDRQPRGYYDRLTDRYRVVVIGDVAPDNSPATIASLTNFASDMAPGDHCLLRKNHAATFG